MNDRIRLDQLNNLITVVERNLSLTKSEACRVMYRNLLSGYRAELSAIVESYMR
jgi:hypothetical protein